MKRRRKRQSAHRCSLSPSSSPLKTFLFSLPSTLLLFFHLSVVDVVHGACQICQGDGGDGGAVLDRDAPIEPIEGYEFVSSCGAIQDLLAFLPEDELCGEMRRALSSVCGCPSEFLPGGAAPCLVEQQPISRAPMSRANKSKNGARAGGRCTTTRAASSRREMPAKR